MSPHIDELTGFDAACREFLRDCYPDADLEYQVYLPESQRRCDFVVTREVDGVTVHYTVETEDDFNGLISSVGQAEMYAGHFGNGVPVLLFPEGHYQQPELACIRQQSPVLLLEVPASYEPTADDDTDTDTDTE